jgi:hypothetical protein
MPLLRLIPTSGAPIEVHKDSAVVGRDPSSDVTVADGSVSRKHARLERRGELWFVVDQGSANGTFLDSARVSESALRAGQELRFGAVPFRLEIEGGQRDLSATIAPEVDAGATIVQPMAAPPTRPVPSPPFPPPPPPPPAAAPPPPPRVSPPPPAPAPRPMGGPPPMSMPPAAPRKGKSPVFWIGLGCCGCLLLGMAIAAAIFGAAWCATSAPVEAVRAQLTELKAGQVDAAYARLSQSLQAQMSKEDFAAFVASHPGLGQHADSTFMNRKVENGVARISGYLTSTTGTREEVEYELIKEGGGWVISAIRFAGDVNVPRAPSSPEAGGPVTGGGSNPGGMTVQTASVDVQPSGAGTAATIVLNVTGVSTRPSGGQYEADIALDLDAYDPNGQLVFTEKPFKEIRGNTSNQVETAQFTAKLTLPPGSVSGRYRGDFVVRDKVNGGEVPHRVNFDVP